MFAYGRPATNADAVAESMPGIVLSSATVAVFGSRKPRLATLSAGAGVAGAAGALAAAESRAAAESLAASFVLHAMTVASKAAVATNVSGLIDLFIRSPRGVGNPARAPQR
jgi:hypothetical protein